MTVPAPAQPPQPAGALAGSTIYLNKCTGGCTVRPGADDATTDTSMITNQQRNLPEYTGWTGTEWADVLQCVKEVYSPFNVHITDVRPDTATSYVEIMVGGSPGDMGLPQGVGGIASIAPGCTAVPRGVSFAFTSELNVFAQEDGGSRVNGMCWIIAQETAHTFGLDHEYEFVEDNRSACNDPMTYRADCGGQKFYRNRFSRCGEDMTRPCACNNNQNSHQALLNVFGAGQSIVPPPTVSIGVPSQGGSLGGAVVANAGSKRGIDKLDLYLNGYKWKTVNGAQFGPQGQMNPTGYQFSLPTEVPNSVYDIVVKAYDDLGIETVSQTVTATKGAACASADTCLKGQKCESGKCFWDPPSGALGDACTYNQFCTAGLCSGTADEQICTQECIPGTADSCPPESGLECLESSPGKGICFFKPDDGGCCSVGPSSTAWIPGGLGALVFAFLVLRPRRRGQAQ